MAKNLIFIVAYNHENKIEKVVSRIPEEILANPDNEVLIIDDGSKDRTFYESDKVRKKYEGRGRITVLRNPVNQGYGGNQKLGYRYAIDQGFDRVFLIHGDGQYAPELLTDFIAEYDKPSHPDAVFGTRMAQGTRALKGGMPLYKFIGNKILTRAQNKILKSSLSEFHSGYRSYSTDLLKRIPFEVNSNDFHFDTEIIIQCLASGAKIVELPIPTFYGDETCHVNGMDYAKNVMIASMRYRIQQMGFLYDRKYDITEPPKADRSSPHSSESRLIAQVQPFSRVLDLGCGRGYVATRLIQKGCIVDGVGHLPREEVDAALRNYVQLNLSKEMEGLGELLRNNEYDYILLADVLENVVEPEKLLDYIRRNNSPRPRPTILASTSNVAFFIVRTMLFLGQFNYGIRGILNRRHTRLFTHRSFRQIFEQAGYVVEGLSGVTIPHSEIFGEKSAFGKRIESINDWLARTFPGMHAYQLLLSAKPLPTANQLLEVSADHSDELRSVYPEERENDPASTVH